MRQNISTARVELESLVGLFSDEQVLQPVRVLPGGRAAQQRLHLTAFGAGMAAALCKVLWFRAFGVLQSRRQVSQAVGPQEVIMPDPKSYESLFALGMKLVEGQVKLDGRVLPKPGLFEKKRLRKGLSILEQAASLEPQYGAASLFVAKVYDRLGQGEDSLHWMRKAYANSPNNVIVALELGGVLSRQGFNAEAVAILTEAVKLDPNDPRLHSNLGVALLLSGDIDQSIMTFERLNALEPDRAMNKRLLPVTSSTVSTRVTAVVIFVAVILFLCDAWLAFHLLRLLVGTEIIEVFSNRVRLANHILWFRRTKEFPGELIREMKVQANRGDPEYGAIVFKFGGKVIHFGSFLEESDAKQILAAIEHKFPQYVDARIRT